MPARVLAWKMYLVQEARRMSDILKKPKENAGLNQTQLETLLRFFSCFKSWDHTANGRLCRLCLLQLAQNEVGPVQKKTLLSTGYRNKRAHNKALSQTLLSKSIGT